MSNPAFGPDPFGGKGFLMSEEWDKRVWACFDEDGILQTCTETYVEPVLEANAALRAENQGKRWGNGQIVASIPTDILYRELMPAQIQGDRKYVKKWLNDSDHAAFRTFEGTV